MVGIHSPEFDFEKERARVEKAVRRYKLSHPIMMDNDFAYWKALGNRYWPSFYLVDKDGVIARRFTGEMHEGSEDAREAAALIEELLAER